MTFVLLSTADTDLLAARASGEPWRVANPSRLAVADLPALLDGADLAVVRLLGGRRTWPAGLDAVLASGLPVVALGGEATPDAELTALSTVVTGVAHDAAGYLLAGGPANLRELYRFLSDTVLLSGSAFEAPVVTPAYGVYGSRPAAEPPPAEPPPAEPLAAEPPPAEPLAAGARPTVGVVFYRAHALAGNTAFVDTLCAAIESRGGNALPVYASSLREVAPG